MKAAAMDSWKTVYAKTLPWCRDHLLSLAILMVFPVAIAGYYWGSASNEGSAPPTYLDIASNAKNPAPVVEQQATSTVPSVPNDFSAKEPKTLPPEELFSASHSAVPLALPIAVDTPEFPICSENLASETPGSHRPYRLSAADEDQDCVWLTGTIEAENPQSQSLFEKTARSREWRGAILK